MTNLKNFSDMSEEEQLEILDKLHNTDKLSVIKIAKTLGTYPNNIRRTGEKLGFQFRNKSQAQSVAIAEGYLTHPTKGKKRTAAEKAKISDGKTKEWANLSDKEREARRQIAKDNWDKKTDVEIAYMNQQAVKGRIVTSKTGSKLERIVLELLTELGYVAQFHQEHGLINERVHIDIFVNSLKTAIEIDGPTHFCPIWGEEKLKKTQETDTRKNGLILSAGYYIVRIQQHKNLTKTSIGKIRTELAEVIDKIKNQSTTKQFTIKDV